MVKEIPIKNYVLNIDKARLNNKVKVKNNDNRIISLKSYQLLGYLLYVNDHLYKNIKYLLKRDICLNIQNRALFIPPFNPLLCSIRHKNTKCCKLLLLNGAVIYVRQFRKKTVLMNSMSKHRCFIILFQTLI